MKIGLAIYYFDPKKGGAERYTYDLSLMLARNKHDVFVFCSDGIETEGITLVKLNTIRFPRWLRNLSFALQHKRIVRKYNLDVLLGFGNTLVLDVYQSHGGVQREWMRREIESYDNRFERYIKGFLLRMSINQKIQQWIAEYPIKRGRFKHVIAISDMIKKQMMQYYSIDESKIEIVYNGVDTVRFSPSQDDLPLPLKVLFSAGNFRLKGLSPLLSAIARMKKQNKVVELLIMGRGRRKRYDKMIDRLGISGQVTFLGEIESPQKVYQRAHVLAHPTFYDACSLTTMEAMASGLPTITTSWNGAAALISKHEGYVIEETRDSDALSSAIGDMLNEEIRLSMAKAARIKMEQYTTQRNMYEVEKILKKSIDSIPGSEIPRI